MLGLAIIVISSQMDLYEILNKSRPFEWNRLDVYTYQRGLSLKDDIQLIRRDG